MVSEKQLKKRKLVAHPTASGQSGRVSAGGGRGGKSSKYGGGGFRVGPAHAPAGSYLGKAKKIKEELIQKAKTKKAYYAQLKREGLPVPERRSARGAGAGSVREDAFFQHGSDDEEDGGGVGDRDGGDDEDGDEGGESEPPSRAEGRFALSGPASGDAHDEASTSQSEHAALDPLGVLEQRRAARMAAGQRKSKRQLAAEREREQQDEEAQLSKKRKRDSLSSSSGPLVMHRHFASAPSSSNATEDTTTSRPDKKKATTKNPEARQRQREAWQRPSGSAQGRARGQPDLGARVGVMLEKIEAQALGVGAGAAAAIMGLREDGEAQAAAAVPLGEAEVGSEAGLYREDEGGDVAEGEEHEHIGGDK
ncbi:hypothetical protein OC835_000600 [Tilletia horrida]|nr:hypothetical protein OC835_000600 [Tilletia horrida]